MAWILIEFCPFFSRSFFITGHLFIVDFFRFGWTSPTAKQHGPADPAATFPANLPCHFDERAGLLHRPSPVANPPAAPPAHTQLLRGRVAVDGGPSGGGQH